MGVLTASGSIGADGNNTDVSDTTVPEPDEAPEKETTEAEDKPVEFVPFDRVAGKTPGSRRERAQREETERFNKVLDERLTKERSEYDRRLAQISEQNARLAGQVEAYQRMPQRQEPSRNDRADPAELRKQARAALDNKDLDTYEKLRDEAVHIEADERWEKRMDAKITELRQSQPIPIDPQVQALINKHPNVSDAGDVGINTVMMRDAWLHNVKRMPPGQARVRLAFEMAEQDLRPAPQATRPAYSRDSAAALTALPTGRPANGGGNGREGHELTPLQAQTAKNAGMSHAEYVKYLYPDRFLGK